MNKNATIAFVAMTLAIIALLAIIIFRQPTVTVVSGKEQIYKDSLALMQKEVDASHIRQAKLQGSYDSLLLIDPQVQYRTHEKIKIIYSTATPNQLDSIIRANWKTELRHN